MAATTDTVHDRIDTARADLTPIQLAAIVLFAAAIGFTLLFLQEPIAHDAMHNFRHGAGITCH
ncbi:CbtB domain-containing protein [Halosolutus amylolyticus]|uniref:CbtB domain-containing protein n=1 Tax=Halosolutus amylolyticus TaxID=2932267 RepID=A0ABD5PN78_9EURY|nr:CbtB domain-containing protein [Halosolutus amylolyticus]